MSAEGRRWLAYAQENRRAAIVCLESSLFNPCLQNAQQAVEKALKAKYPVSVSNSAWKP
jgi:HEPN domain-containing protein